MFKHVRCQALKRSNGTGINKKKNEEFYCKVPSLVSTNTRQNSTTVTNRTDVRDIIFSKTRRLKTKERGGEEEEEKRQEISQSMFSSQGIERMLHEEKLERPLCVRFIMIIFR